MSRTPALPGSHRLIAVYKPVGLTSHQVAIRLARRLRTAVTHTGNLDPMAEGVLVLLIGPAARKHQTALQNTDKEYVLDILFGIATDSYDPLGLIVETAPYDPLRFPGESLKKWLGRLAGRSRQVLPPYASKVIKGRPLFWWARQGRIEEIGLPEREIEIYRVELLRMRTVSKPNLWNRVRKKIARVEGDFRQDAVQKSWRSALDRHANQRFSVATLRLACSKGTYVRRIAQSAGAELALPSLALRIVRTRNGAFGLSDCRRPDTGSRPRR
jgi:tRNA pseudouridine55 synthase